MAFRKKQPFIVVYMHAVVELPIPVCFGSYKKKQYMMCFSLLLPVESNKYTGYCVWDAVPFNTLTPYIVSNNSRLVFLVK